MKNLFDKIFQLSQGDAVIKQAHINSVCARKKFKKIFIFLLTWNAFQNVQWYQRLEMRI